MLNLAFDLEFPDLYRRPGLERIDAAFLAALAASDAALAARLTAARAAPAALERKAESELVIELAPHVDDFIGTLFGIAPDIRALAERHHALAPVFEVKRQFVQRKAAKTFDAAAAAALDGAALTYEIEGLVGASVDQLAAFELAFARHVTRWEADPATFAGSLEVALRYAGWALITEAGTHRHAPGVLFKAPRKIDPVTVIDHVLDRRDIDGTTTFTIKPEHIRRRQGFKLTDQGTDLTGALDQANYCIWCHKQGKDSCSTGLKEKPPKDQPDAVTFKRTVFGVRQAGCPLEEKISEFHSAKVAGHAVGALAIIAIDNPLAAATGHRICNDCMKSCIYQKQEPVNIPQAETRTLKDVLELPWGFEIYSLLTRWNPLNLRRPLPRPDSGRKVLVVGMGPAGFGLAHNLINDGHHVVGIDGLKIEPLESTVSGVGADGRRTAFTPIRDFSSLKEDLDDRAMAGFGGVAEYGITVRWDKNFLKVIRLLLERRNEFTLFGGVRFGGTLTLEDAWQLGFDHVALAIGAGKPTLLDIPNGFARGVRTASDFLMALQLTGAAKADSIANMQLRLPVVVIGGGLTAIDTATESLAYYQAQVEKFLARHEALVKADGISAVRGAWRDEEREIAEEFLAHARAIRAERDTAQHQGREPRIIELLQSWGGVTIAYRRRMIDSPSFTLNHEEVELALQEGIAFAECLTPRRADLDNYGAVKGMAFARSRVGADGKSVPDGDTWLPARTVFVAAGTQPNTVLSREGEPAERAHFRVDGKYFAAVDEDGNPVKPEASISKPRRAEVLMHRSGDGRFVSYFGDVHPSFFGNVVKALGSAKQGYPVVSRVLAGKAPTAVAAADLVETLNREWRATVHEVIRLTPTIVEVVVKAPAAARRFEPGQFYRLQNFESQSPLVQGTRLQMEGLALTGAWVDREQGLVSTIVLEMGGSSDLCAALKPGEPVVLMGPTGAPTHIVPGETVVLVGGGLGNAVLFSIGQAFRSAGSKVLYFAGYKKMIDRYHVENIERAADAVVWCCDEEPGFTPGRQQDKSFVGNIVHAMEAYASGRLGTATLSIKDADRIIAIGSDRMMAAVARARHDVLKAHVKPGHVALGSINSPMQCMMKEICAQCIQPHRDPVSGEVTYVFSCFNQDQELDRVEFSVLNDRLGQNSLQEKLTAKWIERCARAGGTGP
ncbi:MAG: FAD-dependent oxidoreductase [Burkholderiales bacterium]|nr:FAD-dependent oxidoreductase [Burkholderiales bacterium]